VERVTGIGGVFIRSTRPDELRAGYAENLGRDADAANRLELFEPAPGH